MVSNKWTSKPQLQRTPSVCHKGPILAPPGPLIIPPVFPIQIANALIAPNGFTWFLAGCGLAHYEPLVNAWLCDVKGTAQNEGDEIAVWASHIQFNLTPPNTFNMAISAGVNAATPFTRNGQDTQTLPPVGPFTYHSPTIGMFIAALGTAQVNTIDF